MAAAAAAPRPKSPPASPDPRGRHRLQLAVDALRREIRYLEGEINTFEGVGPASICCKEVDEFIGTNPDPFLMISEKSSTESHLILKKFRPCAHRAKTCFNFSWICCRSLPLRRPSCSCRDLKTLCCHCRRGCLRTPCGKPCGRGWPCGCLCSCSKCSKACSARSGTCCNLRTPSCTCL